ncbi:hypothetical protein NE237_010388 [Protea cynaroides]|uniref:Uncharacterized protein n=1 Tax=Protea cynaroides TaxID=273540 RepID=A0A9Q0KZG8_9MAGN|nr:hypothetical protein NE237_010388 [Protea cynaroides]
MLGYVWRLRRMPAPRKTEILVGKINNITGKEYYFKQTVVYEDPLKCSICSKPGHTSDKCCFRSGIDDDVQVEETIINQKKGVPEEGPISREGATNSTSADNTKSNGAAEGCSDDVSNPLVDKSWVDLAKEGNEEDVEVGSEDDEGTSADFDGHNNDVVKSPRAVVPPSNVKTNLSITDNATTVQDSNYGRVDVHGAGTAVIVFNSEVDTLDKNLQIKNRSLTRVRERESGLQKTRLLEKVKNLMLQRVSLSTMECQEEGKIEFKAVWDS